MKQRDALRLAKNQLIIKCCTWWHGSHSAEVNENINLGYSQDQGTPSFRVRVCFRAILLCLILKRVLVAY